MRTQRRYGEIYAWIGDLAFDFDAPFDTVAQAVRAKAANGGSLEGDLSRAIAFGKSIAKDTTSSLWVLQRIMFDQTYGDYKHTCRNLTWVYDGVTNFYRQYSMGWMAVGPIKWGGLSSASLRAMSESAWKGVTLPPAP